MDLKFVKGNVLDQKFQKPTLLVHCCNVYDGFGSGVAGAIAKKYPFVKRAYHDWYQATVSHDFIGLDDDNDYDEGEVPFNLGKIQIVQIAREPLTCIVNMLGQSYPGGQKFAIGQKQVYLRPVRLDSIRECLYNVAVVAKKLNAKVVGPRFAGGLAGGDFDKEIVPLIEECLLKFDIPVTIYELE